MARPRIDVPTYRKHKQSGQAVVTLTDGRGGRKDVLLGKHRSRESRVEYARVIAEWESAGRSQGCVAALADLTVNELAIRYWTHAEQHYRRPDGTPTNELSDLRLSLQPLKRLYGHTVAKNFGPMALKAVRQAMLTGSWLNDAEKEKRRKRGHKLDCSRGVTNQRIGRIRRMFRWAVENELVPSSVVHGLEAVKGLERGRSEARETEPVKPVPVAFVEATLPHMLPVVADMVRLQLHSGMRPGEVCVMRACDLDMSGRVWLYRPGSDLGPAGKHKMAYRGHTKVIPLGPKAQAVVRKYLRPDLQAFLFSPREAMEQKRTEQRARRKSKVQPSQVCRKRKKPQHLPGERYKTGSYAVAITRAVVIANRHLAADKQQPIPHWHPHQLRHTKATEIRREAGLDVARAVLGHRSPVVTEVYAELDLGKAVEAMERLG
jgi:integrase